MFKKRKKKVYTMLFEKELYVLNGNLVEKQNKSGLT